jgi:WhiB family transcriptional regulator, redox-sensing transcriptional regulator
MSRYDWMAQALCAQVDPGLWHSDQGANYTTAKRICADCPVQRQCADHTARLDTDTHSRHGMWAGQTRKQREAKRAHAEREARRTAIVRLIERGGMDAVQIADHVGCSERTVWRVQKALRAQMGVAA